MLILTSIGIAVMILMTGEVPVDLRNYIFDAGLQCAKQDVN